MTAKPRLRSGEVNYRPRWCNPNIRSSSATPGADTGAKQDIFWENSQTLSTSYSIPNNKSAVTAGPVTLGSNVTVTLGTNSRWVVV